MTHRDRDTLQQWIDIGRAELAREIAYIYIAECYDGDDIVEQTPYLKELADRIDEMIAELEGWKR